MSEEKREETLLSKITAKIAKMNPVRLVLVVSATYYVIKNLYIYYTVPRAPAPNLPPDHEERVAKQTAENLKRAGGQILVIIVIFIAVLGLSYVNNKQAKHDEEAKQKEEEIKKYEEMIEEIREKKKKQELEDGRKKRSKAN